MKGFKYVASIFTLVVSTFSGLASQSFFIVLYMFHKFLHVIFPASLWSQILHFTVSNLFGHISSHYPEVLTSVNIISKHYFTHRCITKHLLIFKIRVPSPTIHHKKCREKKCSKREGKIAVG